MAKYAIGIDFGTESGRAVLVDIADGREVATAVYPYLHGVIAERLPIAGKEVQLAWFVEDCTPASYMQEARELGMDIHKFLEEKAAQLMPGESGLLALDWWNGNRRVLVEVDLTGLLLGATLATKAEEIYRALIEATAYGTRVIVDTFQNHGVPIQELVACGGLPEKNKLLMQIFAEVTGREIKVSASNQTPVLGSAMFGTVAAGKESVGYDTIYEAAQAMAHLKTETFKPIPENQVAYDKLFVEYLRLRDYFGRGGNNVMKTLKHLKTEVLEGKS